MDSDTNTHLISLENLLRDLADALTRRDLIAAADLNSHIEQRLFEAWAKLENIDRQAHGLREQLEAAALVNDATEPVGEVSTEGELGATEPQAVEYPVWFATTRGSLGDGKEGFSGARGTTTTYGTVHVVIPMATRFGESGVSWFQRLVRIDLRDAAIRVRKTVVQDRLRFFEELRENLQREGNRAKEVLVFIHGFRTTFEQAAIRTAQIGRDLGLPVNTAGFFSWPSQGSLQAYTSDEAAIEGSEGALAGFLVDMVRESGASKVHLVVHSMGNRGLLRALQRIAASAETSVRFGQIFLAAADLDRDLFLDLAHLYPRHAERTTLYTSRTDLAVYASSRIHSAPRVGLFDPVTRAEGIDTVCVPDFNVDLLGHSYCAQAEAILSDMGTLLRTNQAPPRQRIEEVDDLQQVYWRFRR